MARKLTRKQIAAGFGGKSAQAAIRGRRKTIVAKSRRSRITSRIRSAARSPSTKRLLTRAAAGAVASYAPSVAGEWGPGLALTAVGMATKDDALAAMGEVSLGSAAARRFGLGVGNVQPTGSNLI